MRIMSQCYINSKSLYATGPKMSVVQYVQTNFVLISHTRTILAISISVCYTLRSDYSSLALY